MELQRAAYSSRQLMESCRRQPIALGLFLSLKPKGGTVNYPNMYGPARDGKKNRTKNSRLTQRFSESSFTLAW